MQIINYGTETAPKWLAVATVSIKGEEQDLFLHSPIILLNRKTLAKIKSLQQWINLKFYLPFSV